MGTNHYRAAVDTAKAVVGIMQLVFQKLKVAFNDLVSWLGFVGHTTCDQRRLQSLAAHVDSVDALRATADSMLHDLADRITTMAGMKPTGRSTNNMLDDSMSQSSHSGSPQSNWGTYHFKNGADVAIADSTPSIDTVGQCASLLAKLEEVASNASVKQQKSRNPKGCRRQPAIVAIANFSTVPAFLLVKYLIGRGNPRRGSAYPGAPPYTTSSPTSSSISRVIRGPS